MTIDEQAQETADQEASRPPQIVQAWDWTELSGGRGTPMRREDLPWPDGEPNVQALLNAFDFKRFRTYSAPRDSWAQASREAVIYSRAFDLYQPHDDRSFDYQFAVVLPFDASTQLFLAPGVGSARDTRLS